MRLAALATAMLFTAIAASAAEAGTVLDRVRAEGVVRCGGEPRPGLVEVDKEGHARGLLLDVCRAIAAAVIGPKGRLEFHQYNSSKAFDFARNGVDDVFFLTASEMKEEDLTGKVLPGPPVFIETTAVMVSEASPVQHLEELAGKSICFPIAGNSNRHLEAWFGAHKLDFIRMGYQEEVELNDTYNVQVCKGLSGEVTTLAQTRLDGGINNLKSRILPETLAAFPVLAATSTKDAEWAAVVAWAIHTLERAEVSTTYWTTGGARSLPVEADELKLPKDWQQRMIEASGTYADIYARNLGEGSPYHLPRGLNASWQNGGILLAPYID